MSSLVDRQAGRSSVCQGVHVPLPKVLGEPIYGVALLDRRGCLLGASTAGSLPGEVQMPPGLNLRKQDLRSYLAENRAYLGGRRFPLVSAVWVHVKSKRVRVGIYMESGDHHVSLELLEPDLGVIAAILSAQVV